MSLLQADGREGGWGGGRQWHREGNSCQCIGELVASCLKGIRQGGGGGIEKEIVVMYW